MFNVINTAFTDYITTRASTPSQQNRSFNKENINKTKQLHINIQDLQYDSKEISPKNTKNTKSTNKLEQVITQNPQIPAKHSYKPRSADLKLQIANLNLKLEEKPRRRNTYRSMGGDTESLLQIQAQSQFLFTYLKAKTLVKTGKKGVKADGGGLAM